MRPYPADALWWHDDSPAVPPRPSPAASPSGPGRPRFTPITPIGRQAHAWVAATGRPLFLLAVKLGVSSGTLSQYMRRTQPRRVSDATWQALQTVLGCTPAELTAWGFSRPARYAPRRPAPPRPCGGCDRTVRWALPLCMVCARRQRCAGCLRWLGWGWSRYALCTGCDTERRREAWDGMAAPTPPCPTMAAQERALVRGPAGYEPEPLAGVWIPAAARRLVHPPDVRARILARYARRRDWFASVRDNLENQHHRKRLEAHRERHHRETPLTDSALAGPLPAE